MAAVPTNVGYEPESDGWDVGGMGWGEGYGRVGWDGVGAMWPEVTHSDNDRSVTNKSPATLRLSNLTRKPNSRDVAVRDGQFNGQG